MEGFSCKVIESSRPLTKKETVQIKNTNNCIRLDEATQNGPISFVPTAYAILAVHNEKSEDKDYKQYIIFSSEGERYLTGSEPFFTTFLDIFDEMVDENGQVAEPFELVVFRRPSKNYKGKEFITCDVK